jgi:hypothetical protein
MHLMESAGGRRWYGHGKYVYFFFFKTNLFLLYIYTYILLYSMPAFARRINLFNACNIHYEISSKQNVVKAEREYVIEKRVINYSYGLLEQLGGCF